MNRFELINRALRSNAGASVRAEDLGNYPDFFVDPINTAALEQNTNHLIYGRGGSGKTMMVGALNDRISSRFPERKVTSFAYSATDFRSSPEFGTRIPTVKEKTHAFFHSFIEKLALDIYNLADTVLRKPSWLASLSLSGVAQAERRERLTRLVLDLLEASGYGADSPMPSSVATSGEFRRSERQESSLSAQVGAELALPEGTGHLHGSAGIGRGRQRSSETQQELTYQVQRHFSPYRVRMLLGEIIDLLELDFLIIFIDEWTSLAECQVEFAARLRQCLFNDKRIGVKIAADQYQGQFNNGARGEKFRGLEIDRDIFVAVDLDLPFRDPQRRGTLFAEALYKRLRHFAPELDAHFGRGALENQKRFLDTLFRSDRAFEELCIGAQGLCRDFHVLFQLSVNPWEHDFNRGSRIDSEMVRRAIISKTPRIYARVADSIDSHALLYEVITPYIRETGSPHFILESRPSPVTPVVHELLTKRVIHSVDSATLHPSIRGKYTCFEISRAIFLDLMRAAEYSSDQVVEQKHDPSEVAAITEANKAQFLLDLSELARSMDSTETIVCPGCSKQFASTEKAFEVRHMCPYCYVDIPRQGESDESSDGKRESSAV